MTVWSLRALLVSVVCPWPAAAITSPQIRRWQEEDTDKPIPLPHLNKTCDLKFLSSKLYLFVMTPTTDSVLMAHFFEHYETLGVDFQRGHAHIQLHVKNNDSFAEMASVMKRFGVPEQNYTNVSHYHSEKKRDAVNAWLQTLPEDAWTIYPDNDEFFEFPCSMSRLIDEGEELFWGTMADSVGPRLSMPELQPQPSISQQYPIICPGLRAWAGGDDYKWMLFKVYSRKQSGLLRQFRSSHQLEKLTEDELGAARVLSLLSMNPQTQTLRTDVEWLVDDQAGRPKVGTGVCCFPHYLFIGKEYFRKLKYKQEHYSKGLEWFTSFQRRMIYDKYTSLFDWKEKDPTLSQQGQDVLGSHCHIANGFVN